ncbi:hypothetical protein [Owenweeksia hongkongensis]|uniref:hypothetical protein n=1 Tax=Owenweeksia hongkongensis TaxID=253245 RepID=UPI003A8F43F7
METIDQPETYKEDWFVDLWIIDEDVQSGVVKEGVYLRKWSIHFDNYTLHIEAETNHTSDHQGHYGSDFRFYGMIVFEVVKDARQVFLDEELDKFVADATNYKNYITNTLKGLEVEICID